jgi:hypothetical protein
MKCASASSSTLKIASLVLLWALLCSCRTVTFTPTAGDKLTVGSEVVSPLPAEGAAVKVGPGIDAVPYQVEKDGVVVSSGVLPRDDMMIPVVVTAVAGAVLCVPTLAAGAFCLTNPFLLTASAITGLGACVTVGPAAACTAFSSFSWFTLPCVGFAGLVGMTPLSAMLLARVPKESVELAPPAAAPVVVSEVQSW